MNLQNLLNEIINGVMTTARFMGRYFQALALLTFRPRKFARRFLAIQAGRRRSASSTLFLFTTVLILELCMGIADRMIDTSKSTDVGFGVLLQSSVFWQLSWEELLLRTIPLAVGLLAVGWVMARLCGRERLEQTWLRDIFPYFVWRSAVLTVLFPPMVWGATLLLLLGAKLFSPKTIGELAWHHMDSIVYVSLLLSLILILWRLAVFMKIVRGDEPGIPHKNFRRSFFRLSALASLIIPICISSMGISPAAEKVAIAPEQKLKLAEDGRQVSADISMRNLSGHPLSAKKSGAKLQWWDDENPVTQGSLFDQTARVPNGEFALELPSDTELKESFVTLVYSGNLSHALLRPRSRDWLEIGFGGGPPQKEYETTRKSFEEILNGDRRGRIELMFVVITEGGIISRRTVSVSNGRGLAH